MTGPGRPLYVTMPAATVWLRSRRRGMRRGCYCSRATGSVRTRVLRSRLHVWLPGEHPWRSPGPPLPFRLLLRAGAVGCLAGADLGDALLERNLEALHG